MSSEVIGMITEEEKKQILRLYERRHALNELLLTLDKPWMSVDERDNMHEKIVADVLKTNKLFEKWWVLMAQKYQWKTAQNGRWNIFFDSNEIVLVVP